MTRNDMDWRVLLETSHILNWPYIINYIRQEFNDYPHEVTPTKVIEEKIISLKRKCSWTDFELHSPQEL